MANLYFIMPRLIPGWFDTLSAQYADPASWQSYQERLDQIRTRCAAHGSQLIVVVLPLPRNIEASRPLTDKTVQFLRSKGVLTIDLASELQGIPPNELCASSLDSHPGIKVHARIAALLKAAIVANPIH
jgi:hypothetical protein